MNNEWVRWRKAVERALYGPGGFFVREAPAAHFRTSVQASPLYAGAVAALLRRVDRALGEPRELALVDVGAGRGELLTGVLRQLRPEMAARVCPYAVERAARPDRLDARITWCSEVPTGVSGLLFANEWLDNVPVDVAQVGPDGIPRYVLVNSAGAERLGDPLSPEDARWLAEWWPLREVGTRAELGRPRDLAWARAVGCLERGLAIAVDYAHTRAARPPFGTLTGFRGGREVLPVPDGSCDLTTHVAMDACADAGTRGGAASGDAASGNAPSGSAAVGNARSGNATSGNATTGNTASGNAALYSQREALRALGVSGGRPPLALAGTDPAAYVRALARAGEAAELTDPAGLGSFTWLVHSVGIPPWAGHPVPG